MRDTPEDQRAALDKLRKARPGALVERIDEAISGALGTDQRGDVQRLFELAKAKAFDEVRVRHVDRLTRHTDPRERFAIYGAVLDAQAIIVDASGHVIDPSTELGEVDYYLQTWMAAKERKRIIERTREAKIRLAREGRLVSGRPPFGRTWDKKTGWGIDKPTAALYRRLYTMVLGGNSLRKMARTLNAEGLSAPGGSEWTAAHISHLIADPSAKGLYTAHGHTFRIPAIVDEATWEAARERLRNNNAMSGPPAKHPALLRKFLKCGECGAPLYVDKGGKTRTPAYYYVCSSRGPCSVYHRIERVDAEVRQVVTEFLRRPNALRSVANLGVSGSEPERANKEIKAAKKGLRDLDRQEERVARLLRRGLLSAKVGEGQLEEIRRDRAAAEQTLRGAEARAEALSHRGEVVASLEEKLRSMRAGLEMASFERWRGLLELLFPRTAVTSMRIWPDGSIRLHGVVQLGAAGEAVLKKAGRKLSTSSKEAAQIQVSLPVQLEAVAEHQRPGRPPAQRSPTLLAS